MYYLLITSSDMKITFLWFREKLFTKFLFISFAKLSMMNNICMYYLITLE